MIEEIEDTEEGEMPLFEDSISCLTPEINCVKEGEISNETEVIVTQGEIPMSRQQILMKKEFTNVLNSHRSSRRFRRNATFYR